MLFTEYIHRVNRDSNQVCFIVHNTKNKVIFNYIYMRLNYLDLSNNGKIIPVNTVHENHDG